MTASGKTDRRVIRTRKAIMDAFDKLVVERGIEKLTVSAIAREADIDRKTFYLHYSSIDDLVVQRTEDTLTRVVAAANKRGEGKPPAERVHIALSEVNSILMEYLDEYSSVASSLSVEQAMRHFFEAVKLSLERMGVALDESNMEEFRMRTQFYIAGAFSLYSTWLKSDHSMPIETVSNIIELAMNAPVFPPVGGESCG